MSRGEKSSGQGCGLNYTISPNNTWEIDTNSAKILIYPMIKKGGFLIDKRHFTVLQLAMLLFPYITPVNGFLMLP